MKFFAIVVALVVILGCKKTTSQTMNDLNSSDFTVKGDGSYLAIGDSYTIGEAVKLESNFPYQLAAVVKGSGFDLGKPYIIAKTGWTTSELQAGIRAAGLTQKFKIVTLLIGVNNQYRGEAITTYRAEFKALLQSAIDFADGQVKHVFVVSIPDWGLTPYGQASGRSQQTISAEIDAFNAVNKEETLARGVSYTDITPQSRLAATDPDLNASDGLHPSAKMYAGWVSALSPSVIKSLK